MARSKPFELYPRSRSAALDLTLFATPTSEYRGTPFWSWNNKLDRDQLFRQIDQFQEMGFGGTHIHSRTGLETEYMGDDFVALVKACHDYAASRGMLTWLYDEDRWPSGFAGGLVTKEEKHREKFVRFTAKPQAGEEVARFEVVLKDGRLARYRRLKPKQKIARGANVWYAYLETSKPTSWFNHQTYADTMQRSTIERFIETTHVPYADALGEHFGKTVPAIFTDEPRYLKKTQLKTPADTSDVLLPYTSDFGETYRKAYRQNLEDHLPELIWELPEGEASVVRYRYHDHLAERFASGFGDTLGEWCESHGIALTGHMLAEASLHGQSRAIGEAMRAMRSFQIPGMDLLQDKIEVVTAKQAQSVQRQFDRVGMISELYGVTNWDFDFAGHKRQGDWQAAMGVTIRVPHLAWVSMAGESKRDYPAAIGYQSPWHTEYRAVEDHFSRVNVALTRGKPVVRVAVVHPIESFWLSFGVIEQVGPACEQMQKQFTEVAEWLAYGLIDFDYLCESLLPEQSDAKQGRSLKVGAMKYDAVVVPSLTTIRSTTLARLESFTRAGGTVIFAGDVPELVDAKPSKRAKKLAKRCQRVGLSRTSVLEALKPFAEVSIRHWDGTPSNAIVHRIQKDGKNRTVFLANTDRAGGRWTKIRLSGKWDVTELDTLSGSTRAIASEVVEGETCFDWVFAAHGSLLVALSPRSKVARRGTRPLPNPLPGGEGTRIAGPVPVTLSEPNVLLLDQAEWRVDSGPWQAREEILRVDNLVRTQFSLPRRGGQMAQPWTDSADAPVVADLQLRFVIRSDVDVVSPLLAIEDASRARLTLDGVPIHTNVSGWWVDEAIQTVALPSLNAGEHELIVTIPMTRQTNVEWCYLLGDFGVVVEGRSARITAPVRELHFGDWCSQGLPFYAGNVTYHLPIAGTGSPMKVQFTKFKNPLLTADMGGKRIATIAFAPFEVDLPALDGAHTLSITAYGNRNNAFGPIHHTNDALNWVGPAAWRTTGAMWAYEYQLKKMGLLVAPILTPSPGTSGRGLG